MKKYKVYWNEKKSVVIEAENADQAVDRAWNSEYEDDNVSSEMDGSIEAMEA